MTRPGRRIVVGGLNREPPGAVGSPSRSAERGSGPVRDPDVDPRSTPPAEEHWSDEELTALALAADRDAPLSPDAVAWEGAVLHRAGLLPEWYMATPTASRRGRWPRTVVLIVIIGFLVIDGFGLCITSGFLSLA